MPETLEGLYVKLGVDMSGFARDMIQAESVASGTAGKIKDRLLTVATSLGALRKEAGQVKEALANAADFRVRGDSSLDKLHDQLAKVRAEGNATDKTLDALSLSFEAASKGGNTYVQALSRVAADKNASKAVRELAADLRDEAKEANLAVKELERYQATLNRRISAQRSTFTRTLGQAEKEENRHQVPQYAAASATARLLEGQMSIRAGERFLTGTLGLGAALQNIFPVVGGLAFIGMLDELYDRAQKAYEALKKIQEQPQRIADEFRKMNGATALTNDELRVTNDRLANEIAQLEGKPQNTLKLALDEARVAADKLSESLRKDLEDLNKLLGQENVSIFGRLLGNAGTTDIKKEFGGDSGLGGFYERVNDISYAGNERIRSANTTKEKDTAQSELTAQLRTAYQQELAKINRQLADAEKLQSQRNSAPLAPATSPFGPVPGAPRVEQATGIQDQSSRIQLLKGARAALSNQIDYLGLNQQNLDLTGEKDKLTAAKAADSLTRPYQDKIHELSAQIDGLNNQLASIGQSASAETLAKSWAKAQEEITKLNDELAKHHQSLSLDQQFQLVTLFDLQATTQAEIEWKTKLDQTTDSIQNRIASLHLLTEAIGKGAAAQRAATVESQVMQTLGSKYDDPQWMKAHQADVATLRTDFGKQYDAEKGQQSTQAVQSLTNQIQLERSLSEVQKQGAEAIRLVTLAYRLRELAANGATAKQIQAEIDLATAQKQNKSAGNLANLAEELKATQTLSAAQLQGAEAYRKAQNELKYEQIAKQGASPEEIQQTRVLDAAKHQADVTGQALQTGLGYQNQLESLDQQIAALQQLKATQGDSLAIEESLKALEQERAHVFAQQVSIVGTARDGLHAYFQEMATQGISAAQEVHDVLKNAFDGINDSLAKMIAGQKVSWASLFSGISEQIAKLTLNNLEAKMASVLFPPTQRQPMDEKGPSGNTAETFGGFFMRSLFGGFRADGGDVDAGKLHVVGEEGPELFVPDTDGTIMPADKTKNLLSRAPWNQGLPTPPKYSWWNTRAGQATATLGSLGVSAAFAIFGKLLSQPHDHHFKQGNAYSIPNFNGSYAEGGTVKKGMTHLVGEHGKELFIPKLPPAVKVRDTMPFGGYRAAGGDVDADKAYMVGEAGPEMWTPPTSGGSIVPNHALMSGNGLGDVYIDARNTDPAAVDQSVRRGMQAAHKASVHTSFKSYVEYTKRTPEK